MAFGKTFVLTALNDQGHKALLKILDDKPSEAEARLVKMVKKYDEPLTVHVHITKEEFIKQIEDASHKTAERLGRLQKRYNVDLQVHMLMKQMTIKNVLNSIVKSVNKVGATLFDIQIEVMDK